MAAATLAALVVALRSGTPAQAATVAFVTLGLAQGFHLGTARSDQPLTRRAGALANPWALAALATVVALQVGPVLFAPLARLLGLVPLEAWQWALAFGLSAVPAVVGQLSRWHSRPRAGRTPA
jgi:magnesium-transporting ATPase (P-type)